MNKAGVYGAKELIKLFDEIPASLSVDILRNINRSGARIYKDEIRSSAPVGNDHIYKAVKIENDRRDKTAIYAGVGSKGFMARFIEFGTAVRKTKGNGDVQKKPASRGSITPRPFVQPAIERATKPAIDNIWKDMGKVVLRTIRRAAKKVSNAAKR